MKYVLFPLFLLALSLPACKPIAGNIPSPPSDLNVPENIVLQRQDVVLGESSEEQNEGQPPPNDEADAGPATVEAKFAEFTVELEETDPTSTDSATRKTTASFRAQLFPQIAPATVANFTEKANSGAYDGLTFHRVEDWVVQGGDPNGDGTGGGKMRTELNAQQFIPGSLGMARGKDKNWTNDMQFFIVKKQVFGLDKEYTNFGLVIEGGETVARIAKGDRIVSIRVR